MWCRVGGTTGAIVTCPLEVVKTRLQSSNSGFETKLRPGSGPREAEPAGSRAKPGLTSSGAGKVSHVVYRPVLGSQYTYSPTLLHTHWGHFGSSCTPILYSTQSQPCRPLQSKLSAFGDRTSAKVHTGSAVQTIPRPATQSMGVWACLK